MTDPAPPDVGASGQPFPDFKDKGSLELMVVCDEVARVSGGIELAARILDHCREANGWIPIKLTDLLRSYSGKDDSSGWPELTSRLMRLAAAGLVTPSPSSEEVRVTAMFITAIRSALYRAN